MENIDDNTILTTINDKKIFLNALLNPPAPNEALRKALSDYKRFKEKHPDNVPANKPSAS